METWKSLFTVITIIIAIPFTIFAVAYQVFDKFEDSKVFHPRMNALFFTGLFFGGIALILHLIDLYEIETEQECRETIEYMRSIGKDVSGMSCPNKATLAQESELCVKARETLKEAGNDVSGIQCVNEAAAKSKQAECQQAYKQLKDAGYDVSSIKCDTAS